MVPGEWRRLAVNGLTSALFTTGANWTSDWMSKGSYDPVRKQIRWFGNGHLEDRRWHQYDEATNTWSNLPDPPWDPTPATPVFDHGYHGNAVDPATGDWYYNGFNSATVHRFVQSTGTWATLTRPVLLNTTLGVEWLPSIGSAGGLVVALGREVQIWDKAANSWSRHAIPGGIGEYEIACRSIPNNVVVVRGGGQKMYKVGPAGALTAIADCPINNGSVNSITACCPTSGNFIVIAGNNTARYFSFTSGTWSSFTPRGLDFGTAVASGSGIIAIPIPAYGVIAYVAAEAAAMWLYKHA